MQNGDVYRCHACLSVLTDLTFSSLNLGAAVQLTLMTGVRRWVALPCSCTTAQPQLADAAAVAVVHWEQSLAEIGFLDPASASAFEPAL
jgi:tRNA/rRNA methyltransferase